jgi:hypothetical protein
MKYPARKTNWLIIAILAAIVTAASLPMYYFRIMSGANGDYSNHLAWTYALLAKEPWPLASQSHPLLQIILAGLSWISRSRIDPFYGMIGLLVVLQLAVALMLYFWFGKLHCKGGDWIRALAAFSLTLVTPILAFLPLDHKYFYGYIAIADYHNPTIQVLRPLAMISFYLAYRIFEKPRNSIWVGIVSAVVVILSALAKPNYLLCILPAIFLLGMLWSIQRRAWDWRLFLIGFLFPGVLVLLGQWLLLYASSSGSGVIFDWTIQGLSSKYLFWKFLLSALFPIVATLLLFKKVAKDPYILLGWFGFVAGAGMFYLVSEGGRRIGDGNFTWGAQIMLFLLMAALVRFCLRLFVEEKTAGWKRLVIWGAYLLHVASGVIYYIYCLTSKLYT